MLIHALMLSLKCLGLKEGDEVITTPYTFYATIGAIVTAGAKPIFADVDEDYNIDPKRIEKKIGVTKNWITNFHAHSKISSKKSILFA